MDIGVFLPVGNNGWLISTNSPQYLPSFAMNKAIAQKAEAYGFDFALSMIKLHGFGGQTEFWNYNLESFTLMASLAAVTTRIKLFASTAILTLPPAIVARMASTIDSVAPGRFGVNIVSGWQRAEYDQMGLWPGDQYFGYRYEYASEYVRVMQDLWTTGESSFKGEHFQMEDCQMKPMPSAHIDVVCAGQSEKGMAFAATYGDYNFCLGIGINTPTAHADANIKLLEAVEKTGRDVRAYVLFMIIADETDAAAEAKWASYKQGADHSAFDWMAEQSGKDKTGESSSAKQIAQRENAVNHNIGLLVGSYAKVARLLDEVATIPGTGGIMLIFDDWLAGIDAFGKHIQPQMACRAGRLEAAA